MRRAVDLEVGHGVREIARVWIRGEIGGVVRVWRRRMEARARVRGRHGF